MIKVQSSTIVQYNALSMLHVLNKFRLKTEDSGEEDNEQRQDADEPPRPSPVSPNVLSLTLCILPAL